MTRDHYKRGNYIRTPTPFVLFGYKLLFRNLTFVQKFIFKRYKWCVSEIFCGVQIELPSQEASYITSPARFLNTIHPKIKNSCAVLKLGNKTKYKRVASDNFSHEFPAI